MPSSKRTNQFKGPAYLEAFFTIFVTLGNQCVSEKDSVIIFGKGQRIFHNFGWGKTLGPQTPPKHWIKIHQWFCSSQDLDDLADLDHTVDGGKQPAISQPVEGYPVLSQFACRISGDINNVCKTCHWLQIAMKPTAIASNTGWLGETLRLDDWGRFSPILRVSKQGTPPKNEHGTQESEV